MTGGPSFAAATRVDPAGIWRGLVPMTTAKPLLRFLTEPASLLLLVPATAPWRRRKLKRGLPLQPPE